jgi:hypothetical protein
MSGGLLNLVAKGAQDLYLIGNPQMTYFKIVYRRYVNFSIYDSYLQDKLLRDFNTMYIRNIDRNGDLLGKLYFVVDLPQIQLKYKTASRSMIYEILK